MTKTQFLKEWAKDEELFEGVPSTLIMAVNDHYIQYRLLEWWIRY